VPPVKNAERNRGRVSVKALFHRRSILVASIAVLIAVITIVSVNVFSSSGPVTGIAGVISRPIRMLASNVARVFENIYSSIYRYDSLMARHEELLRTLTEYEENYRESNDLKEENDRFRVLLDFRERHTGYDHEQVKIINPGGDNWSHSFTIDKGYSNSQIERGDGVTTADGMLIGQVTDVGATESTVITILDTTFSAGAFVGDDNGNATAKGDFSLMRSGLLMLDHISDDLVVLRGDFVVTSGTGGVYPRGLIIGNVVDVFRHNTGIGRYATVKPMLDIETITYAFVITDFETAGQIEEEIPPGEQ
jgi:rod shape-determining protein MreC